MRIPGFTAETSLYNGSVGYSIVEKFNQLSNAIRPQFLRCDPECMSDCIDSCWELPPRIRARCRNYCRRECCMGTGITL